FARLRLALEALVAYTTLFRSSSSIARFWPIWLSTIKPALPPSLLRRRLPWLLKPHVFSCYKRGSYGLRLFLEKRYIMTSSVDELISQAQEQFAQASDAAALENAKARFLGKQGAVTALLKGLSGLEPEQKRQQGARINQVKQEIEKLLNERRAGIAQAELDRRLASETIDVTLPGRGRGVGGIHPVIQT